MRYLCSRHLAAFAALATLITSAALVGDGIFWP